MDTTLYIDEYDALEQWGARLLESSLPSLIAYAPAKAYDMTDWPEEDGVEIDLDKPLLDTRTVTLNFSFSGPNANPQDLIDYLHSDTYNTFSLPGLGLEYTLRFKQGNAPVEVSRLTRLRLNGVAVYKKSTPMTKLTLTMQDDAPQTTYPGLHVKPTFDIPVSPGAQWMLDDSTFGSLGARVLEGARESLNTPAPQKDGLTIRQADAHGVRWWPDSNPARKKYEASVPLLMTAQSYTVLLWLYYQLLRMLVQPGIHTITPPDKGIVWEVAYSKCTVNQFYGHEDGKWWLKMTLKLIVCNPPAKTITTN